MLNPSSKLSGNRSFQPKLINSRFQRFIAPPDVRDQVNDAPIVSNTNNHSDDDVALMNQPSLNANVSTTNASLNDNAKISTSARRMSVSGVGGFNTFQVIKKESWNESRNETLNNEPVINDNNMVTREMNNHASNFRQDVTSSALHIDSTAFDEPAQQQTNSVNYSELDRDDTFSSRKALMMKSTTNTNEFESKDKPRPLVGGVRTMVKSTNDNNNNVMNSSNNGSFMNSSINRGMSPGYMTPTQSSRSKSRQKSRPESPGVLVKQQHQTTGHHPTLTEPKTPHLQTSVRRRSSSTDNQVSSTTRELERIAMERQELMRRREKEKEMLIRQATRPTGRVVTVTGM